MTTAFKTSFVHDLKNRNQNYISMANYKIEILVNGKKHYTLSDILPIDGILEILFIAKTPAPISVEAGHYFQGKQGTMLWNMLSKYDILQVHINKYPDECLLSNDCGITDIVKVPRDYGKEPSDQEYKDGLHRVLGIINKHKPKVIVFVYKKVLDNIIHLNFGIKEKSIYGFNSKLEKYFSSKVFVFPMPGTPCKKEEAVKSMSALRQLIMEE